jgi:hypothetical protein
MCWRPTWPALSFEGGAPAVAFDVHLEDRCVVDKAIDGGECHGGIGEDLSPFSKWLICGDEDRSAFVSCTDEFEQYAGLGLVLGDVGEIVEDQEVEAIEAGDSGLKREIAACDLELLDEIGGAGIEHAPSILDQSEADGGSQMAFSAAGRTEQKQVGALGQPAVAGRCGHDLGLGLGDHRHGFEVEGVEGLSRWQAGLREMALDASPAAPMTSS